MSWKPLRWFYRPEAERAVEPLPARNPARRKQRLAGKTFEAFRNALRAVAEDCLTFFFLDIPEWVRSGIKLQHRKRSAHLPGELLETRWAPTVSQLSVLPPD